MQDKPVSAESTSDDALADDLIAPELEDDPLEDTFDGEAVVVPGQRPGPTEPTPR